jgi:hypothetical protein
VRVKASRTAGRFDVTGDGRGIEARAGLSLPAQVANHTGLTDALRQALGGVRSWRDHHPGVVARDLAVMLVDGGECVSDLAPREAALFDAQAGVGTASQPTAWRTLEAIADDELALLHAAEGLARTRGHVWGHPGGAPPVLAGDSGEPLCVDLDATVVTAHSEKHGAAGTYKGGFGYHPDLAFCDRGDGTGEALAGLLRPGNAGANTTSDHCDLFDAALAALPTLPQGTRVVVRGDSAYATKGFLAHVAQAGCGFSVGFELSEPVKAAIRALPKTAWQPALRQDGQPREGAAVADATQTVALPAGWPASGRLLIRREPLHPGAQQTFDNIDGYRFTAVLTDQADADIVTLEQRHRARARAEDRIADLNDLGLANLPCDDFDRNAVWLHLTLLALNLVTWTQVLTLDGELATARPKRLRYQLFHVPARIARSARRTTMRLPATWPSTDQLLAAFARLRALPPAPA